MLTTTWEDMTVGFTRAELEHFRDALVPDMIGPDLKLLFVGINPGLWSAAARTHFASPSNRFYPALLKAGIIERDVDRSDGMSDADRDYLLGRGLGITNVVHRATAKASELTRDELRAGGERLRACVALHQPAVVAVAGITAYRDAFARPKATTGLQDETFEGIELWVVPNPSGLNAHETVTSLAAAYRAPAWDCTRRATCTEPSTTLATASSSAGANGSTQACSGTSPLGRAGPRHPLSTWAGRVAGWATCASSSPAVPPALAEPPPSRPPAGVTRWWPPPGTSQR